MAKNIVNKAVGISIGLTVLFLLASTLIMPNFRTSWQYCQNREWVCAEGAVLTNCTSPITNQNTTLFAYGSTHTESGQTDPVATDSAHCHICLNCKTAGGYRATNQGLTLLVLVIALISFGLYFFKTR